MNAPSGSAWRRLVGLGPWGRGGPFGVLDFGTAKLCCMIVRPRPGRGVELLGRGYQRAEGVKAGEIINAADAEAAVLATLHEAEQQAGEVLREIVIAVGGGRPRSSYVRVALPLGGRTVAEADVTLLLDRARRAVATPEREVIHVVPLEVTLDDGRPLRDPAGMTGQKLEVVAHCVTVAGAVLRNALACFERCHVQVRGVVASSYAAGLACLGEDEAERGCLVVDLGGGTTGLAHFANGRLTLIDQEVYGGDHVTSDLAFGLSTSRPDAERIKNLYGGTQFRSCDDSTRIEVPLIGDQAGLPTGEVSRTRVTEIVRPRVEETLQLVLARLEQQRELLGARPPRSVVLTGGGSQLDGIGELVQEMFGLPVRCGRPAGLLHGGAAEDGPCCAAVAGTVGLTLGDDGGLGWSQQLEVSMLSGRLARLGEWFKQNF